MFENKKYIYKTKKQEVIRSQEALLPQMTVFKFVLVDSTTWKHVLKSGLL